MQHLTWHLHSLEITIPILLFVRTTWLPHDHATRPSTPHRKSLHPILHNAVDTRCPHFEKGLVRRTIADFRRDLRVNLSRHLMGFGTRNFDGRSGQGGGYYEAASFRCFSNRNAAFVTFQRVALPAGFAMRIRIALKHLPHHVSWTRNVEG